MTFDRTLSLDLDECDAYLFQDDQDPDLRYVYLLRKAALESRIPAEAQDA